MTALPLISSKILSWPHSPPKHLYTSSKHAKNVCPWIGHLFYVGFPLGSYKYQRPFATIIRPLPASHCSCTLLVSHLFKIWPSLKITSSPFHLYGPAYLPSFYSFSLSHSLSPSFRETSTRISYLSPPKLFQNAFILLWHYIWFLSSPLFLFKKLESFLMEPLVNMFH